MNSGKEESANRIVAELEALTAGAGICRRDDRILVRVVGDDRVVFFHGMCSNDIKALKPGMATYALILTDHAHLVADLYVLADENDLYLETDRASWPRTREHLEKFLVADDVEMEALEDSSVIDVAGPKAATVVGSVFPLAADLAPWRFVHQQDRLAANLPRIGLTAFTVVVPTIQVDGLLHTMMAADPASREVSVDALEILRVEQGFARVGLDTSDRTLALEARLERGISFNKGCYIGQETVERATARGGVKKRLFGLRIADGHGPNPGSIAWLEGKEVGHVTSIAKSPRLGTVGLGILNQNAWKPGATVMLKDSAGETPAVISDLPFE
jgi:folate-binding protein YgfZ